ncbi:unnamed protein product, partial [Laminaria digitata]
FAPVLDVTRVKGLKYDSVILVDVSHYTFRDAKEARHLLHTASTQAVHWLLWMSSVREPSLLVPR